MDFDYRKWPSNIHFLCGGRCICGSKKDFINQVMTLLLITYIVLSFHLFVSPLLDSTISLLFIIIVQILPYQQFYCIVSKDPGVILRGNLDNPDDLENQKKDEDVSMITEAQSESTEQPRQPLRENRFLKPRYCRTCRIIRPSRSSHCRHCDHCVKGFDHHCFWVGSCIGIRNWRNFVLFLTACFLSCLFMAIQCLIVISERWDIIMAMVKLIQEDQETMRILTIQLVIFIFAACCRCHYVFNITILIIFAINSIYLVQSKLSNIKEYPQLQTHYYNNPCYVLAIFIQNVCICFGITGVTFMNWFNASQFKTTKELDAEYRLNFRLQYSLNVGFILNNLKKFLTYKIPESEIGF